MKKYSWLTALENLSLIGLGAGSVASLLLNQAFYTTAPLSLLVALELVNRRRLAQIGEQRHTTLSETDKKLALHLQQLHRHVASMPTPETIDWLNRNFLFKQEEVSEKLHSQLSTLKQSLQQQVTALEQQEVGAVRQDVQLVAERCESLVAMVNRLETDLGNLKGQIQTDGTHETLEHLKHDLAMLQTNLDSFTYQTKPNLTILQEHITRLDRQFSKLPPPIDVSSLKQEVGELIRIVADLVPRRDLSSIVSQIRALHDQQETLKQSIIAIETAALNFKRSFSELPQSTAETNAMLPAGAEQPKQPLKTAPAVYPELQELATTYLGNLWTQLSAVQTLTTSLAQQQKQLREQLNHLPQTLDVVALQRQLSELSQRVPVSEATLESFNARIQDVLHQELHCINQQLQAIASTPHSELVFDFYPAQVDLASQVLPGSRAILEQALESTEKRLILIWPWAEHCELDDILFSKFEAFLSQGRQLEIGWCYLAERNPDRWISKIQRSWISDIGERNLLQETLHQLLQLKRLYPEQFQFKILGTNENFLVSDQNFAVLGIADALKTKTPFPELQLKLKTTDAGLIQRLIQRFDDPEIAEDDLISYWNRAVTRYDLGDKVGAIADYSHILKRNPDSITYNHRGLAYYELGDYDSATADFTEAIRLTPHQAAAYCNRGFICSEQGNHWEAINNYTQAIQARPDYAIAYFHRGMTQQKLENYHEAITNYNEAIRLAADVPIAYYYRGLAWQKLENDAEAMADFELAAQFFWVRGSKTNAQKALRHVARLREMHAYPAGTEAKSEAIY
jgi:tetratricopeptide (TPR) repeat protein